MTETINFHRQQVQHRVSTPDHSLAASSLDTDPNRVSPDHQVQAVYTLSIDVFFNARHFVISGQQRGPVHSHTFRVNVTARQKVASGQSYAFGFGEFRSLIQDQTRQFNDRLLNEIPPFSNEFQPTTENLASVIFKCVGQVLTSAVEIESVTIWESPTASVKYSEEYV